jgi:hypothetical protein
MAISDWFKSNPITPLKQRVTRPDVKVAPPGRVSQVDLPNMMASFEKEAAQLAPEKYLKLIPLIRKSYPFIQNLALAIQDMVQLTNTGHKVYFDNSTKPELVKEMRDELIASGKSWLVGGAGVETLVNKMITQIYIGGAISTEWVPSENLDGIETIGFINPETVVVEVNSKGKFTFFQQPANYSLNILKSPNLLIALNPLTYKYIGMSGDTDDPRGIPPLVSALEDLGIQRDMMKNIKFIVEQLGILGFIELLMEKPPQNRDENPSTYKKRLENLLIEAKTNLLKGTKEGMLVGYDGDHEFEFHSTTNNISGLDKIYALNQKMVANGLKYSGSFMGTTESTDTNISIIFTKMLSQLHNVQLFLQEALSFGYTLHLRLKGYEFKNLTVEFNPSTISDDLKLQQATEIKIRNQRILYADGIISLQTYADNLNYERPDQAEPRAPIDPDGTIAKEKSRQEREKKKDDSDRRVRDKNNPQPKRRDNESKTP